jgi:transcriptional regulator with XRE-family HTH domain
MFGNSSYASASYMSTDLDSSFPGAPELTALGKRIEVLRIQRGLSKQFLARQAGTSRQQLWRVMTGKSELTSSLEQRLASALAVDPASLAATTSTSSPAVASLSFVTTPDSSSPGSLHDLLAEPARLEVLCSLLPADADGVRLKRALLDAIEECALASKSELPAALFELRRRVLAGEC